MGSGEWGGESGEGGVGRREKWGGEEWGGGRGGGKLFVFCTYTCILVHDKEICKANAQIQSRTVNYRKNTKLLYLGHGSNPCFQTSSLAFLPTKPPKQLSWVSRILGKYTWVYM